ncbi:lipid II flippase MurJ [Sphingomonas sp. ABOLG]|uniref:lipid II flippase MurJ n=1 Tax=Sphingomonas sp. ABOLG TaxID=1985880 RepID=UPI0013DE2FA1|nr:lipid II flippase MurJ [Sphingomonas sp. ABOLG]
MKLQWDFVGLLGARGAKLTLGLAMMFVYARVFGASATYDAWIWALGIVNAAGMLLFGPITETIRASYASIDNREGEEAAEQYIATIAVIMIGGAILVAGAAALALPTLATALVPQQSGQAPAATFFLYALAPSLALSQVVAVLTAHLNCHGRVYAPEIAGTVGGCVGLALIVTFPQLPATWLLLGSYYVALVMPLLVGASFWPQLVRALLHLKGPAFRRHAREALGFSMPLLLPYALGQVGGVVERQYALLAGTGALSILSYAFFARNTVQAVFTAALSALAVPALARTWNAEDIAPFRATLTHWVRQCLMLVTIGMVALFGLSDTIPPLLFGDNITGAQQSLLSELLRFYAVAIVTVVLYLMGGSALLAARRGKTYAALGALASLVALALLLALFPLIGIIAIPVGLTISHALAAGLMFRAIDPADGWQVLRDAALRILVVVVAGSMLRGADTLLAAEFGLPGRLVAGGALAILLAGLWWLAEHWLGRDTMRSTPTSQALR